MGNGVYFKMIGCCHQNRDFQKGDIDIEKNNIKNISYIKNINNQYIIEEENVNKKDQKIRATNSKQSSGSCSLNKVKQIYVYENSSNKDQNISINNTMQMNNSNVIKNNLIQNNQNRCHNTNPIDELKHKGSLINYNKVVNSNLKDNFIDIKTKLLLIGDLFSKDTIEINKYGIKNGLRQKKDSLSVFGIKEKNNGSHNSNTNNCDYYFDMEKFDENNSSIGGKVFEIFINKKNKTYTLYFLHNSLILYYKINNNVFFDMEKDYYLILGDIFLTIIVKKKTDTKEKTINIQTEIENEKPNKYTFEPKDMPIRIGRVNCHINIPRPSISKLHSIIDFLDDEFFYKDCGSTNGSTLLVREDDSLKLSGEMSFKLEDISFKIKEVNDEENYIEENFGE
jgi:hypothetical protein